MTTEEAEAAAAAEGAAVLAETGKCTRQPALTADRKQKSLSSQPKEGRYTAGIVIRSTKNSNNEF